MPLTVRGPPVACAIVMFSSPSALSMYVVHEKPGAGVQEFGELKGTAIPISYTTSIVTPIASIAMP